MSITENLNPQAGTEVTEVGAYRAQTQAKHKSEDLQFPLRRLLALLLTLYHFCIIHRLKVTSVMCRGRRLMWRKEIDMEYKQL